MSPLLALLDVDRDAVLETVLQSGARILLILALAYVAARLLQRLLLPLIRVAMREQIGAGEPEAEVKRRIETLSDVLYRTVVVVIGAVAIVTILPVFGINAGPLIAGLGLVGLAVGFGSQNLVRDVINGIEILLENQYARGDFVKLGGVSGVVEDINLRRTVLRDVDGSVHFVAHGQVDVTTNQTRGFSRVYIALAVPESTDLDRVFAIVNRIGEELRADSSFGSKLREAPRAAGLDSLGEGTVAVRIVAVTEPGERGTVAWELRRRLKLAFDTARIRVREVPPSLT